MARSMARNNVKYRGPPEIRCNYCETRKPPSAYSEGKLRELQHYLDSPAGRSADPGVAMIIRCNGCSARKAVELKCTGCNQTKKIDQFNKTNRKPKARETALCEGCCVIRNNYVPAGDRNDDADAARVDGNSNTFGGHGSSDSDGNDDDAGTQAASTIGSRTSNPSGPRAGGTTYTVRGGTGSLASLSTGRGGILHSGTHSPLMPRLSGRSSTNTDRSLASNAVANTTGLDEALNVLNLNDGPSENSGSIAHPEGSSNTKQRASGRSKINSDESLASNAISEIPSMEETLILLGLDPDSVSDDED